MEYISQQEQQEKMEKVKCNDPCPCGSGEKFKKCCGF
ncbi:MAG: SEC-C domain-containing protein [Deltaproteobacteria bacterium]|nr:SEC-C domain-containing protein [Deltaproteobacteria bacterium]